MVVVLVVSRFGSAQRGSLNPKDDHNNNICVKFCFCCCCCYQSGCHRPRYKYVCRIYHAGGKFHRINNNNNKKHASEMDG